MINLHILSIKEQIIKCRLICLIVFFLSISTTINAKKACEISFDLKSDLIVVTAEVDGQEGAFVLDTGTHFGTEIVGLHKSIAVAEQQVRYFNWACLEKRNLDAMIVYGHLVRSTRLRASTFFYYLIL